MTFQIYASNHPRVAPIKPELIGHFSVNEDEDGMRKYDPGLTWLKYYKRPSSFHGLSFDLNLAYDQTRRKTHVDTDNNNVLFKWILDNFDEVYQQDDDQKWSKPDIVCFRGILTKIYCTCHEKQNGWLICAVKFDDVIYLIAYDTETEKQRKATETEMDIRRTTWGFKFEQFLLSNSPMEDPKPNEPLDETKEFCCTFKAKFGNTNVLYGAEIDGVISKEEITGSLKGKNIEFIELKTNKSLNKHWKVKSFYKYKSLKWWVQSYLAGINTIACGFRTEDGIVEEVREISLDEIRNKSRDIWNSQRCTDFTSAFLEHIKKIVTKDYDKCLYKFLWDPKCGKHIVVHEMDPHCDLSFLPEWYINKITALKSSNL